MTSRQPKREPGGFRASPQLFARWLDIKRPDAPKSPPGSSASITAALIRLRTDSRCIDELDHPDRTI